MNREPLTNEDLATLVKEEIRYTLGGSLSANDTELNIAWEKALQYYYGKPRGDEVEGRSKVISMDVADMIEQTLAQILPAYEKEDLCTFSGPDSAKKIMESEACNYLVLQANPGYVTFIESIKDALLQRNGIVKILVDESTDISYEEHEGVPELLLPEIVGDGEVVEHEVVQEEIPPTVDFASGMVDPGSPAVFNIQVKRSPVTKKLKIIPVAPEEFAVNRDHNSIFLNEARFVRHTKIETESSLIAAGYDPEIVKELKTYTTVTEGDKRARSRDSDENEYQTAHHSNRNIEVNECYYLIDFDNDGIAERRRIVESNGEILENEWFPCVPFAAGSCYIMPHRFWGLSFYDKLKQTQDTKTAFLRKTLDNAEGLINQRVIANPRTTNFDDLLSSRPTGVIRSKNPTDVVPFPVQNLGDTGFTMLTYMDKVRKEAAGSQLEIGTAENAPVASNTAHGMERWMTSKEHLAAMFAKSFAETLVKETYRITHKLVKIFMPETMAYESKGEFKQTTPAQWQYGDNPKVTINMSVAESQKEYQALDMILQQQIQAIEKGTGLTSESKVYNTLRKQAATAGIDNVADYWIDPISEEGQQLAQQRQQKAEQDKQEQIAQEDKLYQTQLQISSMQEQSDQTKSQLDFMIKENEQLRKWVELELQEKYDMPGQGTGQ